MKIGIFTNNYLPNPYGVSTSIETFRREFEKQGHEVFIFAPQWKGYEDKHPRVFRYPSIETNFKFKFPLAIPYSWKMRKILLSIRLTKPATLLRTNWICWLAAKMVWST